jgi:hypothetical protein
LLNLLRSSYESCQKGYIGALKVEIKDCWLTTALNLDGWVEGSGDLILGTAERSPKRPIIVYIVKVMKVLK